MSNKILYDSIPPGYYYYAFKKGNSIQRFWHKYKFKEIIDLMNIEKKKIIDIGCGPGVLLSLLPQVYKFAIGLDLSKKQIEFAKNKFKRYKKIEWVSKDLKEMKFNLEFDYAVFSEIIEHINYNDSLDFLKRIKKTLKKDGKIIITTPNYRSLWPLIEIILNKISKISYEKQHMNKLNIPKLKELLRKAGFKIINIKTIFIISPFLSILSKRLARIVFYLEKKLFSFLGSIIIVEAS